MCFFCSKTWEIVLFLKKHFKASYFKCNPYFDLVQSVVDSQNAHAVNTLLFFTKVTILLKWKSFKVERLKVKWT